MPLCVCVLLSGKQEDGEFFFYLLLSSLQHKIIVLPKWHMLGWHIYSNTLHFIYLAKNFF